MPVPFEALLPLGIITALTAVTGIGLRVIKRSGNDGKDPRIGLDSWDHWMMRRDQRLTGTVRGQDSSPEAPAEFATNSKWYAEKVPWFKFGN